MSKKPTYIPPGYHTVTPFLTVSDVAAFAEFARKAFDASVSDSITGRDGSILHVEVKIGDSVLMVGPVMPDISSRPASLYLYVPDVDATYRRALEAGATSMEVPTDEFWGDRAAGVNDAFGNGWWIATRIEELTHDELQRRSDTFMRSGSPAS